MDEFHKYNVEPTKLDTEDFKTSESVCIGVKASKTNLLLTGEERWVGFKGFSVWVIFSTEGGNAGVLSVNM